MAEEITDFERRTLVGLIVGIHIALIASVKIWLLGAPDPDTTPLPETWFGILAEILLTMVYQADVSLVCIWGAIGRVPLAIRLPVVMLALTQLVQSEHPTYWWSLVEYATQFLLVTFPLLICRFRGLRVRNEAVAEPPEDLRRFEIWHLLALTVGLAVVFTSWRVVPLRMREPQMLERPSSLALIAACSIPPASIALVAVWAWLQRGWLAFRLGILTATSLVAGAIIYQTAEYLRPHLEPRVLWMAFFWIALQGVWLSITLGALRWCGYLVEFPQRDGAGLPDLLDEDLAIAATAAAESQAPSDQRDAGPT